MRYISTRSSTDSYLSFEEIFLRGVADDGGLFVPESWPQQKASKGKESYKESYKELATRILLPYMDIEAKELSKLLKKSYKSFNTKEVVPLRYLEELDLYLLELFHGPTLAFKDVALQLIGNLFEYILNKRSEQITILTATSGDTGAAAIYACLGKKSLRIVVLHPNGLVSNTQRKMMTSVDAPNVFNISVEGNFDDCQSIVKRAFQDQELSEFNLAAMNSINWARIVAQAVYYFYATQQLGQSAFSVPSGNFGNIYAGWVAKQMGADITQLIAGVNQNDTLANFLKSGELNLKNTHASLAPSMDVSIPSNLERLIYELTDRSGSKTMAFYKGLEQGQPQKLELDAATQALWNAYSVSDAEIGGIISKVHLECDVLVDPHTAVGIGAMLEARKNNPSLKEQPQVVLATAHPAKFGELYTGFTDTPSLPAVFTDLSSRKENYQVLPNDYAEVKKYIQSSLKG